MDSRKKLNPTFSTAMYMDVVAFFMKLSAWKRTSTLVSLDSILILGQGSPWKGQQNSNVKHKVNHSERCKGDVRERIINLSLGSPHRNTDLTSGNSGTRPLLPLKASGRLGNSGAAGKASELPVMFKENLCKILRASCNQLWASQLRNTWRASGF